VTFGVNQQAKTQVGKTLKKHVAIIQSANKLSLLQRKIGNALLYYAYQFTLEQEVYEVSIAEICRLINYKGLDYGKIKSALKALNTTEVEWNILQEYSVEEWGACTLLAGVTLRSGKCRYSYYYDFKKLIFTPDMYGKINLTIQAKFTSTYGLALYENCIRYRGLPSTKWFTMQAYRSLMGIEEGKYLQFRDLKRRVLEKSIQEVNKLSDIQVEPDIKYVGRKPNKIRFKIQTKTVGVIPQAEPSSTLAILKEQFVLTEKKINLLVTQYGINFLQEKIDLIKNSRQYQRGQVKSLSGLFLKAVEEDYKLAANYHIDSQQVQQKRIIKENKVMRQEQEESALRIEYSQYKFNFISTKLEVLAEKERDKLLAGFSTYIKKYSPFVVKWFKGNQITMQVLGDFINYLRDHNSNILDTMMSEVSYIDVRKIKGKDD